ncbi:MAG TPA: choice-of-anchor Q domain-containing protein, partial [Rudaea sp.]|nr:choice-of-anchor Q domain-containing protein [Rudaea sp.]
YQGASGHLYLQDTKVNDGHITGAGQVNGGCIATQGSLTLNNVEVYECSATTTGLSTDMPAPRAFGGGVYAATGLTISGHSLLDNNTVTAANSNVRAQGGCAETPGTFDMRDSIVARCYANGSRARGGALELKGAVVTITGSVIAKSYSNYIGGVDINSTTPSAVTATISNSTIAYNHANKLVGGLYAIAGHVNINNSTIVFNTAGSSTYTYNTKTYYAAPGVEVTSYLSTALSLQSTIIANNTISNGTQVDLSTGAKLHSGTTITGSNNLVRAYLTDVTLPSGQGNLAKGTCPKLGHARNNGGSTYTFAPQSGSPVIDAGNNTAIDPRSLPPPPGAPAVYDQRGGPTPPPIAQPPDGYPRVSGPSADIGAHEVQKSDIVYYTEFETGCE